jgi:replicative DNA helicase
MSIEEERDRLACLVANVPYSNILTGSLLPQEKNRLELTLRRMENLEGFTMIHDRAAMTLDKINQKIVEYQPDAVFIDGVYFMEDQYGEPPGTPRALTNITRGLKKMAQNHRIPVIATTQALAHKLRRGELQAESIGYSSSFLQDADVILGVERMTDEISRYKVLLSRSGPLTETYIKRDLTAGTLEEVDKAIVLSLTQHDGGGNDGGVI